MSVEYLQKLNKHSFTADVSLAQSKQPVKTVQTASRNCCTQQQLVPADETCECVQKTPSQWVFQTNLGASNVNVMSSAGCVSSDAEAAGRSAGAAGSGLPQVLPVCGGSSCPWHLAHSLLHMGCYWPYQVSLLIEL